MDIEEQVALIYLIYRRYRYKRKRRCWMKPLLYSRLLRGSFSSVFEELVKDETKFYNYFRMTPKTFDELLCHLKHKIMHSDTSMRLSIVPEERLVVALRYLASGHSFRQLQDTYRIGISTVRNIVKEVTTAIVEVLKDKFMPIPTEEQWREIASGFQKNANFPNCLGALGGKLLKVLRFCNNTIQCKKSKNFMYLILFAIADTNNRFIFVDVNQYLDVSESSHKDSTLYKLVSQKQLNIPGSVPLPHTDGPTVPYTFIGNDSFGLSQHVVRPYSKSQVTKKKIFNYRLTRAQRVAECTFAVFSKKWEIFHRPLTVALDLAVTLTEACCILHNFIVEREGVQFEDTLIIQGLQDGYVGQVPQCARGGFSTVRDQFADYFVSDVGAIPWQNSRI